MVKATLVIRCRRRARRSRRKNKQIFLFAKILVVTARSGQEKSNRPF